MISKLDEKVEKINSSLSNFLAKEEEFKKRSRKMVNEIVKKSDQNKVVALKKKIADK